MEHVVFYPSADGVPSFERVSSLDAAVSFVEHLRNSENVTEFSVQALTPVPLSFRAYYHVEVPEDDALEAGTPAPAPAEPVAEAVAEPAVEAVAEPVAEPVTEPAPEAVAEIAPEAVAEPAAAVLPADAPEPVAEAADESAAEPVVEVVAEDTAPAEPVEPAEPADVTTAPVEAADDDRSAEWVAEASVVEPPVADAPVTAPAPAPVIAEAPPVPAGPFATAPPVTPTDLSGDGVNGDIVPVPTGRRSMGFFAR